MEDAKPKLRREEEHDSSGGSSHGKGHSGAHRGGHGGGGHDEHQGAPEWLISFADNVTLIMGFFVILLALNLKPPVAPGGGQGPGEGGGVSAAVLDWVLDVRAAFNNPVDINSTDLNDQLLVARLRERMKAANRGLPGSDHEVESVRPSDNYGEGGRIRFARHSSTLTEPVRAAVAELADQHRGYDTVLEVRGHCSAAEAYDQPDRGMSLAHARALAVARELVVRGIPWRRLRLVACADNERLVPPTRQEADDSANQRVEVLQADEGAR